MLKLFAICLLFALANASLVEDFETFKEKFEKSYGEAEEHYRLEIFKENVELIQEHNAKNLSYTLGVGPFADLTSDEFGTQFGNKLLPKKPTITVKAPSLTLPSSVDWRQKGAVTPVKNQGQCGSCWAFSTTGAIEGAWFLHSGHLVSLSEQNLVDCDSECSGCSGGLMDYGFQWVIDNGGIDKESCYPYEARDDSCRFSKSCIGATISSYQDVPSGDADALKQAVAEQPVSIGVYAVPMQHYSGGIITEGCDGGVDHGVLLVGYGEKEGDHWIVKNSWGPGWGEDGYCRFSRKGNTLCIENSPSYPLI